LKPINAPEYRVMDSQTQPPAPTFKPMTLALACLAVFAAATAVLPQTVRPWNVAALGALALFASARLRPPVALLLFGAALAIKELGVYLQYGYPPHPPTWICYAGYALLGWALLRKTESPLRIGGTALGASGLFFLTTNFGAWLEQALPYGYSFQGLLNCYAAAIPFYRGTLLGDLVFSGALFGAHAVLSRAYFPAERVGVVTEEVRDTEGHW
jgi:hypothetical protein